MESPFQNFEFEQIYNSSPGSSSAFKAAPSTPDSNFSAASNSSFYSSSGFDIISILSQLHKRPKKKIELGPVDHSCAFLLSDAQHRDFPIIYASPNFEKLTGYSFDEIKGRNCRFLQSPDGIVESGSIRKHTDNWAVKQLKFQTIDGDEQQVSLINYKKNGEPFVNLVTVIPIIEEGIIRFYLGLQVDMIEQPGAILNKMTNGTYAINYSNMTIPTSITSSMGLDLDNTSLQLFNLSNATPNSLNSNLTFKFKDRQALNSGNTGFINWHQMLVDQCDNLVHILSLRGVMLYASKSCETLLGYSSSKLQNRPLSEICHPADINPVLREIKSCSESQDLFSLIYRLKHIDGSFIWFETFGKIHTDSSTSRKCIILSAKPIKMPQLPSIWAHILGGLSDSDFWWRMTSEGLVLSATSGMESNLGSQYKDCIGTSLYQLIHPDSCLPLTACLEACKTGRVSGLRYFTVGLGCKISEIESIFYPSGTSPSHILVKCRLVKEETDRRLPAPNVSYPLSDGLAINFNPPYLFGELLPSHDRTMKYEVHRLKNDNARLRDELKRYEANESSLPPAKIQRSDPTQNLQCPQCRQYSVTRSLALDGSKIDMCTCGWQCIS